MNLHERRHAQTIISEIHDTSNILYAVPWIRTNKSNSAIKIVTNKKKWLVNRIMHKEWPVGQYQQRRKEQGEKRKGSPEYKQLCARETYWHLSHFTHQWPLLPIAVQNANELAESDKEQPVRRR